MKIVRLTLRIIICVLCFIIALAFLGIEGFALISAEWMLYENIVLSLIQKAFKATIALMAFGVDFIALMKLNCSHMSYGIGFLAVSFVAMPFSVNRIGWFFIFLSVLFILTDKDPWKILFTKAR